jgi:membrane-associated phospholipid phosphatase
MVLGPWPVDSRHWIDPATGSPWPWQGVDAPWTFEDAWTVLGQALRKTRARIVQPSDLPDPPPPPGQLARDPVARPAIWRWAPEFRVQALLAQLHGRTLVQDGRVHLLSPLEGRSVVARLLADVEVDLPRIDWPDQIDKVMRAAVEREDRLPEILAQVNSLAPFYESITGISAAVAPLARQLLDVAEAWTIDILMNLKNHLAARRPVELSGAIVPVIATPGHGSVPSGHATLAALLSTFWSTLLYPDAPAHPRIGELDRLARRIAFNRTVAGVHFPVDNEVGYRLGVQLARAFFALAGDPQRVRPMDIAGDVVPPGPGPVVVKFAERGAPPPARGGRANPLAVKALGDLQELRARAQEQIDRLRV